MHQLFPQKMLLLIIVTALLASGCVRRRMTIRSNPPGAMVHVDDQPIGMTPVSTSFRYYGTRKIKLVKDGYETHTAMHTFQAPWYEIPPLDFVSEALIPKEIRDERILKFRLLPQRVVTNNELISRANNLRLRTRQGIFTPTNQPFQPSPVASTTSIATGSLVGR